MQYILAAHIPNLNWQLFRCCSALAKTHYEILNLKNDCTYEEVRLAFLKLSKKHHPDVKGLRSDARQTEKFVKISEAYQVLSKPLSRNAYDERLLARGSSRVTVETGGFRTTEVRRPWEINPDYNANPGPYYGIKGIEKISNLKIVFLIIAVGIFGAIFSFVSVMHLFTFSRKQLDEKSKLAAAYHEKIRANAEKLGNEEQLRRLANKFIARQNDD